jgi:hypothetical protein
VQRARRRPDRSAEGQAGDVIASRAEGRRSAGDIISSTRPAPQPEPQPEPANRRLGLAGLKAAYRQRQVGPRPAEIYAVDSEFYPGAGLADGGGARWRAWRGAVFSLSAPRSSRRPLISAANYPYDYRFPSKPRAKCPREAHHPGSAERMAGGPTMTLTKEPPVKFTLRLPPTRDHCPRGLRRHPARWSRRRSVRKLLRPSANERRVGRLFPSTDAVARCLLDSQLFFLS